jgi:hypothetical protein
LVDEGHGGYTYGFNAQESVLMVLVEGTQQHAARRTSSAAATAAADSDGTPLNKAPPPAPTPAAARAPRTSGLGRLFSRIGVGGDSVAPEVTTLFLAIIWARDFRQ